VRAGDLAGLPDRAADGEVLPEVGIADREGDEQRDERRDDQRRQDRQGVPRRDGRMGRGR
jgi:hypothetical protein